jgi:CelD/BcsL family acetyltransferase involved in cellulose biosynthesis
MVSLRSAIEEGFRFFDFMRGDESYKSNWGAQPRPAIRLRVWQRNVTGRLQQLVETARQNSKPVVSKLKSLVD